MLTGKQFVEKLVQDNQALFKASQHNVKAYFDSKPAQSELVDHFIGRMVNERMNMVEISQAIANMPADADPVELQLLTQQVNRRTHRHKIKSSKVSKLMLLTAMTMLFL
jgi:hypothetical protein